MMHDLYKEKLREQDSEEEIEGVVDFPSKQLDTNTD